jgi:YD repeat-containing protein
MSNSYDLQAYQASPFLPASVQDLSALSFIYQASPFLLTSEKRGTEYLYDSLSRLVKVSFTNGTTIDYNYDSLGNRTSVVTTCGPGGC